jgi:hypothetical protein
VWLAFLLWCAVGLIGLIAINSFEGDHVMRVLEGFALGVLVAVLAEVWRRA